MKIEDLLNDIKLDTQTYLQEDIVKKGRKYFIVKYFDGTSLPGAREEGYASIENAVMEMLSLTKKGFRMLSFTKKQEKIRKFIDDWKKEHNVKEKKSKRKYGFETYK